jgi:hypothetical protein
MHPTDSIRADASGKGTDAVGTRQTLEASSYLLFGSVRPQIEVRPETGRSPSEEGLLLVRSFSV